MTGRKQFLIAFFLNLSFAILEAYLGMVFCSSAILADSLHDFGDALALGLSTLLESYSEKPANNRFTLGYKRLSLLASLITALLLIGGSFFMIIEAIPKLFHPQPINQKGMFFLGLLAIFANFVASQMIKKEKSLTSSLLSLHFLEDILGWLGVIVIAIVVHFTQWYFLDPLLSLCISIFILFKTLPKAWSILCIFLQASPSDIDFGRLKEHLQQLPQVETVYQLHIWTLDGSHHQASIHVQAAQHYSTSACKQAIRSLLEQYGLFAVTIELDGDDTEHKLHDRNSRK